MVEGSRQQNVERDARGEGGNEAWPDAAQRRYDDHGHHEEQSRGLGEVIAKRDERGGNYDRKRDGGEIGGNEPPSVVTPPLGGLQRERTAPRSSCVEESLSAGSSTCVGDRHTVLHVGASRRM